jgi:hypothetical protein
MKRTTLTPTVSIHFIRLGTTLRADSIDRAIQTLRDGHGAREFAPWKQGDECHRILGIWKDTGARLRYEKGTHARKETHTVLEDEAETCVVGADRAGRSPGRHNEDMLRRRKAAAPIQLAECGP